MFWVYKIEIGGIVRYIGYTNDLERRVKEHNYLCFKKEKKKKLYDNIRINGGDKIELLVVGSFRNRIDAKRFECFMILKDYFSDRLLWQSVPKISDM